MVFRSRPVANATPVTTSPEIRGTIGRRYRMMQNLASLTGPFLVQTDEGNQAFRIERITRHLSEMLTIQDLQRTVRCCVPLSPVLPDSSSDVLGNDGRALARIVRAPVSAVRDRIAVELDAGGSWEISGNVGTYEYRVLRGQIQITEVSRRWFLRPGTFGVEVAPGNDDALVLAVTAAIDRLAHDRG